jgi:uncharacterized membrane protein
LNNVGSNSSARAINKKGFIVGETHDATTTLAASWVATGAGQIINPSPGIYSYAQSVSDFGTIVGTTNLSPGTHMRGVIWVPTPALSHLPPPELAYCGPL